VFATDTFFNALCRGGELIPPGPVRFSGALLDLVSQVVKEAGRFRVVDRGGQAAALDDLFLNLDQQFDVFCHGSLMFLPSQMHNL
jgi:hypothetical protein